MVAVLSCPCSAMPACSLESKLVLKVCIKIHDKTRSSTARRQVQTHIIPIIFYMQSPSPNSSNSPNPTANGEPNSSDRLNLPGSPSLWISLATAPLLVTLVGAKAAADALQQIGIASEELFRGDRLPILRFPTQSSSSDQQEP